MQYVLDPARMMKIKNTQARRRNKCTKDAYGVILTSEVKDVNLIPSNCSIKVIHADNAYEIFFGDDGHPVEQIAKSLNAISYTINS